MSQQVHSPSTDSGITNPSRDFVALVLSGSQGPRAAVSRYSYINALTLAARPAEPNANRPLKYFLKNNFCRDVKTTAIRIADGDQFGMEELLNSRPPKPERQSWKVAAQFRNATKEDASSPPTIWADNRTEQARAPYDDRCRAKRKLLREWRKIPAIRMSVWDDLPMINDPKYQRPLPDQKSGQAPQQNFRPKPKISGHSQNLRGRSAHDK